MKVSEKLKLATNLIERATSSTQKVESLAKDMDTTPHFLQQISGQLRKSGLIETVHGPGGGVQKPAGRLVCSLYDICKSLGCSNEDSGNPVQSKVNEFLKNSLVYYNADSQKITDIKKA
jgi:DNA-binding IscR family transcriptional regulator